MDPQSLADQLVSLPDIAAQRAFLTQRASDLDDALADALKAKADSFLRSDLQRSLQTAALLCTLSEFTGNPCHCALGLLAEANARSIGGLGEYQRAVELYDEAAEVYKACGKEVEHAKSQVGKVWSLASLGRYDEAFETGAWASRILEEHAQWQPLGNLTRNLSAIHGRRGEDALALVLLDRAGDCYRELGPAGEPLLAKVYFNQAILLRNLGRFEDAIQTSQAAQEMLTRQDQPVEAARARQNLAVTYYVLGRYNEALTLLDEVRSVLIADGRRRDVVLLELFTSDCLLQLRRFADVLDKCRQARKLFTEIGTRFEAAQAILNESAAFTGLQRYDEALASLDEARCLFDEETNQVWGAYADLARASVLLRRGQLEECLGIAMGCSELLQSHGLPVGEAQACLIAAQAELGLRLHDAARKSTGNALAIAEGRDLPALTYQCYYLVGAMAEAQGRAEEAQVAYAKAIHEVERLRGRLMVEFRSSFLEDKDRLYEDMVGLCLDLDQPAVGLEYAERAKSRALLDLLAYHIDLAIEPRDSADRPLIEKLIGLRGERDRIHRQWLAEARLEGRGTPYDEENQQAQKSVLSLERQITELWHQLLVRHADYARDAALHEVRTESVQPFLPADTLLLEYFIVGGRPVLFLVTSDTLEARRLPVEMTTIQRLLSLLWLNLDATRRAKANQIAGLITNARRLLRQLYDALLGPVADAIAQHPKLIIVPHGLLHYLPFHALCDDSAYLIERHEISYLPGASLLTYCCRLRTAASGLLALGYSCGGRLPFAVQEARAVAERFGGELRLEEEATVAHLRAAAAEHRIVHLATHGDFRPDNPLFSGLALADGWLTTLDCFSLRLNASLVTLSGCQTGRSVVGGGDELLGLSRGLLSAGAASLLLSLWAVDDVSTEQIMGAFYGNLVHQQTKGQALRQAQLQFIQYGVPGNAAEAGRYSHPYFWAPFSLVGDAGAL